MSYIAAFNDMMSMTIAAAWAPFNYAVGLQSHTPPPSKPTVRASAKTFSSRTSPSPKLKADDLTVIATRSVLLRTTSSLTQVSTACQNYCARLSQAFTALRFMEAMSSIARPFFPIGNSQTFGLQSWFPGISASALAPNSYWANMTAPLNSILSSSASPFLAIAPKREIEGGIAMGMAILFVTANAIGFDKI